MVEDLLVLVVVVEEVEVTGADLLQESLATLVRSCGRSTGTLMSFQSFKRTSTRSIRMQLADPLYDSLLVVSLLNPI